MDPFGQKSDEHENPFQYFSSRVGISSLSNFCASPFEINDLKFPSVEHGYQALCKCEPESWHRFAIGGDLANLESGLAQLVKPTDLPKKLKFWGAKGNRKEMVGIVAKMAVEPKRAKGLGLELRSLPHDGRDLEERKALFSELLVAKYQANADALAALLSTGNKVLIEFDRGAGRRTKAGDPPLWTGLVEEGTVLGQNVMGELMMEVRAKLRA